MRSVVFGVVVVLALSASFLLAQDRIATIVPASPKIGDEVAITYNSAAKGAVLTDAEAISAEVLLARDGTEPELLELAMKKSGKEWKASFKLTDEKSRLLLLRFSAGDKTDDNGENVWDSMVYGTNGKPLKGAHMIRFSLLKYGTYVDFKHEKDGDAANAELAQERELYPDSFAPVFARWFVMMREAPGPETNAAIKEELEKEFAKGKATDDDLAQFAYLFEQVGMKEKAEEIRKGILERAPTSKAAFGIRYSAVAKEPDLTKRAEAIDKLLAEYPQDEQSKKNYDQMVVYYYYQSQQFDKLAARLESMHTKDGQYYNSYLAWPLIEKGEDLEKAVAWAKKGIDLMRSPDPSLKPSYQSVKQWKESNEQGLAMTLDTYAFGLFKLGKGAEAESAYEEAVRLNKGSDEDVNQRLVECYVKNGKLDKAMSFAVDCIRKGKSNDELEKEYKDAYVKTKGSDKGLNAILTEAKEIAKENLKKELLRSRVNRPAIDFELKGLDGKTVKLSDLRGKVVVVDFWATWCGPCKASFPYLQKVYEKYKDNPKVAILALDTWERVGGKERQDLVKDFLTENKYTFPVLYDSGFVEKYRVDGIPTKFVIDKKGMVQFKTIGFTGAKMIDELTIQIDLLLDDNFYISMK